MLSHQDNETLVRVGRDTPMGSLFRLFWIPFFFSKDLITDGQPKRVMLLGEDLVAFRDSLGRVGLVANAWLEGTSAESWDKTFAVNLRSHMLTVKHALPKLADGASIVFISSIAGLTAGSRLPAYDASKAGLFGLCRHVAFEGARRAIRANVVAPGLMDTFIGRLASRGRPNRAASKNRSTST